MQLFHFLFTYASSNTSSMVEKKKVFDKVNDYNMTPESNS